MRYPKGYKAESRQRILDAAATVFRRDGYHAGGVDAVMREAGMTAGGFYAHFRSKETLFAACLQHALRKSQTLLGSGMEETPPIDGVAATVTRTVNMEPTHRVSPAAGKGFRGRGSEFEVQGSRFRCTAFLANSSPLPSGERGRG